jgi:hypothetical protein
VVADSLSAGARVRGGRLRAKKGRGYFFRPFLWDALATFPFFGSTTDPGFCSGLRGGFFFDLKPIGAPTWGREGMTGGYTLCACRASNRPTSVVSSSERNGLARTGP